MKLLVRLRISRFCRRYNLPAVYAENFSRRLSMKTRIMTCGSFLLQKKNSLKIGSVCDSVRSVTQISTLKPIGGFRIIQKRQLYWNKIFGRAVESKAIWQDGTFQSFSIFQYSVFVSLTNPQKCD